jgi:hypothetical protein
MLGVPVRTEHYRRKDGHQDHHYAHWVHHDMDIYYLEHYDTYRLDYDCHDHSHHDRDNNYYNTHWLDDNSHKYCNCDTNHYDAHGVYDYENQHEGVRVQGTWTC